LETRSALPTATSIQGKTKMFDFAAHRRPAWYGPITGQDWCRPSGLEIASKGQRS
jgi:hypothetical protein